MAFKSREKKGRSAGRVERALCVARSVRACMGVRTTCLHSCAAALATHEQPAPIALQVSQKTAQHQAGLGMLAACNGRVGVVAVLAQSLNTCQAVVRHLVHCLRKVHWHAVLARCVRVFRFLGGASGWRSSCRVCLHLLLQARKPARRGLDPDAAPSHLHAPLLRWCVCTSYTHIHWFGHAH